MIRYTVVVVTALLLCILIKDKTESAIQWPTDINFEPNRTKAFPNDGSPIIWYMKGARDRIDYLYAEVKKIHLGKGTAPSTAMQNRTKTLGTKTDDAGHIVARNLGGRGDVFYNIFPQSRNINRGVWAQAERDVYNDVNNNKNPNAVAKMWFYFEYTNALATRPTAFNYKIIYSNRNLVINNLVNP